MGSWSDITSTYSNTILPSWAEIKQGESRLNVNLRENSTWQGGWGQEHRYVLPPCSARESNIQNDLSCYKTNLKVCFQWAMSEPQTV